MKWGMILIILSGMFLECGSEVSVQPVYRLDSAFTIGVGETVVVSETPLRITFNQVISDSRCPEGAVCFWPGNGEIELTLKTSSRDTVKTVLNTFLEPHDAVSGEYRITLTDLKPYPQDGIEIDPESYLAILKVEKNRRRN